MDKRKGRRTLPQDQDFETNPNYNPMAEDYEDREFNRYNEGVGRDLLARDGKDVGVKLFVGGVPMDLGQEGFSNLFSEYGNVIESKLCPPKDGANQRMGFGFVTMETAVEAEKAISILNGKSIGSHILNVKPAHTEEEKRRRKVANEEQAKMMADIQQERQYQLEDSSRVGQSRLAGRHNNTQHNGPMGQHMGGPMGRPMGGGPMGRPGPMGGHMGRPMDDTGLLGRPPLFERGMGRGVMGPKPGVLWNPPPPLQGYGMYNGGPPQSMGRGLGRNGPGGYPNTPTSDHVQAKKTCLNCRKEGSTYRCSICKMYYCSVECQKEDWPRHQLICQTIREYLDENCPPASHGSNAGNNSAGESRHPQANKSPNSKSNLMKETKKSPTKKEKDDGYESDRKKLNKKPLENRDRNAANQAGPAISEENSPSISGAGPMEGGDASSNMIEITIPEGAPGKCIMTHYESPDKFWMSLLDQADEFSKFSNELQEAMGKLQPLKSVKTGDMVGVIYDCEWNRARVVVVNGNNITVFLVDYGLQRSVQLSDLRHLDVKFVLEMPAQVLCCCLSNVKPVGSSWSEAANSFIKEWLGNPMSQIINFSNVVKRGNKFAMELSTDEQGSLNNKLLTEKLAESGTSQAKSPPNPNANIRAQTEKTSNQTSSASTSNRRMVRDMKSSTAELVEGTTMQCVIPELPESPEKFVIQTLTQVDSLTKVEALANPEEPHVTPYRPVTGELVLAKFPDENWYRCEVLDGGHGGKFAVIAIDYGTKETCTSDRLSEVKDSYLKDCPAIAISCTLHEVTFPSDVEPAEKAALQKEMQSLLEAMTNVLIDVVVKENKGVQLSVDILRDKEQESLCQLFSRKLAILPRIPSDSGPANFDSPQSKLTSPRKNANLPSRSPRDNTQSSPQEGQRSARTSSSRESVSSGGRGDRNQQGQGQYDRRNPDRQQAGGDQGDRRKQKISLEPEVFPESGKARGIVTHFKTFDDMYVRLTKSENTYNDMMQHINKVYSRMKNPMKNVSPGMIVGALDLEAGDKFYYRAEVKNVDGDVAAVSYIDFGNSGQVSLSDIRPGLDEFSSCPAQAIKCCIKDVPNCPAKLMKEFKFFLETNRFKILKHDPDNFFVTIFTQEGKDVTDVLKEQMSKKGGGGGEDTSPTPAPQRGDATGGRDRRGEKGRASGYRSDDKSNVQNKKIPTMMPSQDSTNKNEPLMQSSQGNVKNAAVSKPPTVRKKHVHKTMEKNKTIAVECSSVISPMDFVVQCPEDLERATEITINLTTRIDSGTAKQVPNVSVGDFVASRFSQDEDGAVIWYRCSVLSVSGSGGQQTCKVLFVDYGNYEERPTGGLMELQGEELTSPACTLGCSLRGCSVDTMDLTHCQDISQLKQIVVREQDASTGVCTVDILASDGSCMNNKFIKKTLPAKSPASKLSALSKLSSPLKPSVIQLETESLPYGKPEPVCVVHINSCTELYVSPQEGLTELFTTVMPKLKDEGPNLKPLSQPVIGSFCAAKWSEDDSWYRACVKKMKGSDTCVVQFVDFGNCAEIAVSSLKQLSTDLATMKAQAVRCCLKGHEADIAEDKVVDADTLERLHSTLNMKTFTAETVECRDGVHIINLKDENQQLINKQFSPAASLPPPTVDDLKFEKPSDKEFDAQIFHANNLENIFCVNCKDKEALDNLSMELEKEKLSKAEAPVVNGVYACQSSDGVFHRCQVQDIIQNGSKVLVLYLDYGMTEEKDSQRLFALPRKYFDLPVKLVWCKLNGVEPVPGLDWNSPDLMEYRKMLVHLETHVTVARLEDTGRHLVSLAVSGPDGDIHIADDLVSTGLVNPTTITTTAPGQAQASAAQQVQEQDDDEDQAELERQIEELQKRLKKKGR